MATLDPVAAGRRRIRQIKLEQAEIPKSQVRITDDLLGRGGFGEVYLADYNNRNVAAKVPVPLAVPQAISRNRTDQLEYYNGDDLKISSMQLYTTVFLTFSRGWLEASHV